MVNFVFFPIFYLFSFYKWQISILFPNCLVSINSDLLFYFFVYSIPMNSSLKVFKLEENELCLKSLSSISTENTVKC